jgi:serine/threonine-protein kinase
VLEDVLVRLEALGAAGEEEREAWRALALRCLGPDEERPGDGTALVRALP